MQRKKTQLQMGKRLFILGLLFFLSCSGLQNKTDTTPISKTEQKNELLFLVFKIMKGANPHESKITLIQQSKSEGKMKIELEQTPSTPNYLTVICYGNAIQQKTLILPHPLYKQVEYLNDSNQYISKDIELEEDTFYIRLPYDPKIKKISIFEKLRDTPKEELFTLNL
jgi:hypothetical protein